MFWKDSFIYLFVVCLWILNSFMIKHSTAIKEVGNDSEVSTNWRNTFDTWYNVETTSSPATVLNSLQESKQFINYSQATRQYLESFSNDFQREIVKTQLEYCPFVKLCHHSLRVQSKLTEENICCHGCSCNISSCAATGSCCPDILSEDSFNSNYQKVVKKACIPLQIKGSGTRTPFLHYSNQSGFIGIHKCKTNTDNGDELHNNCTRIYTSDLAVNDVVPCFSLSSLEMYRNKYCAKCNGENNKNLQFFSVKINSYQSSIKSLNVTTVVHWAFTSPRVEIEFVLAAGFRHLLTPCMTSMDRCNITGMWKSYNATIEQACLLYESKTSPAPSYYLKNIFCNSCNGVTKHGIYCINRRDTDVDFPFSGLLRLDNSHRQPTVKHKSNSCETDQFYDNVHVGILLFVKRISFYLRFEILFFSEYNLAVKRLL